MAQMTKHLTEQTETHFLTHANWNSMPEMFSSGTNETGVRSVINGVVQDDFRLLQHGWYNWELAADVMKRLFAKGKDFDSVEKIMSFIDDKRWNRIKPTLLRSSHDHQ